MSHWSLQEAFSRHQGLLSAQDQITLQQQLVVIPGCGGIGSTVAETLARLGIGRFRLCDPDSFDVANFNRQLGATMATVGQNKARAVAERIRLINPSASIEIVAQPLSVSNAAEFVSGAAVVLDGLDFFALRARRALFAAAKAAGIPAMTAAPLGFSGSLQVYLPDRGLSFDEFFDFRDEDGSAEQIVKFLVGLAPRALQQPYMDLGAVDVGQQNGPSSILGTQVAASLIGGEVLRILLQRGRSLPAPWYRQFDVYRQRWVRRYLPFGNRFPVQRLKIALARRTFQRKGLWQAMSAMVLG